MNCMDRIIPALGDKNTIWSRETVNRHDQRKCRAKRVDRDYKIGILSGHDNSFDPYDRDHAHISAIPELQVVHSGHQVTDIQRHIWP